MKYINVRKTATRRGIRTPPMFLPKTLTSHHCALQPAYTRPTLNDGKLEKIHYTSIVPTGPTRHYTTSVHDGLSTSIETLSFSRLNLFLTRLAINPPLSLASSPIYCPSIISHLLPLWQAVCGCLLTAHNTHALPSVLVDEMCMVPA